jgi:hypothetical protein
VKRSENAVGHPRAASLILLSLVVVFCATTHWGRTYPTFIKKTWIVWSSGRVLTAEQRRLQLYDQTYPAVLYVRENTPENAVILLPPSKLIDDHIPGDIPILASPSAVYDFIYPRVPVHWGDPAPGKNKIDYLLVWDYWGLDLVQPGAPRSPENRTRLFPWPAGRVPTW